MSRLRVAVVGTGTMGVLHAATIASYPRCEFAGWVTGKSDVTALAPAGPRFSSIQDAAAAADAFIVATPDFAHLDPVLAAIALGKHVLVEKPLATSLTDALAIQQAADRAGLVVMTLFSHRWAPAYAQAFDRVSSGRFGPPVLAYAKKNDTIAVPTSVITWADRTTPSWFLSSHDIDLVTWIFGERIIEVHARKVEGALTRRGIDTPDAVVALVRFEGGAAATFESCWIYPNAFPTMTDSYVELIFQDGALHLDRREEQLSVTTADGFEFPRNQLFHRLPSGEPGGAGPSAVRHFVDCVIDKIPPLVTLASSVHVCAVLEAVDVSAQTGNSATPQA